MLTVIAKVTAKTEQTEAVKAELESLIVSTRKEDGCKLYDLHQDIQHKNTFFFYEEWESKEHLEKHAHSEHMVKMGQTIKDWLEKPMEVSLLEKL
jgi:quinol monooxygenase YgiN